LNCWCFSTKLCRSKCLFKQITTTNRKGPCQASFSFPINPIPTPTRAIESNMNTTMADDPRANVETIITSLTGIVITIISASVSIIASALVIYIILRSTVNGQWMKGLRKSAYHRIMFGMNAADILQSTAIAFTTLPMPKDMIYSFKGVVIGNHTSCQVQGFFVVFGCFMGMMYNAALSIYYLCSINYNMMDQQFRKCLEPCLHVIDIFGGFIRCCRRSWPGW